MPVAPQRMPRAWTKFLLVRLPLAVLIIGVACQLVALALADLPMRRNRIDEMALAVLNDRQPRRVVLLGDSIIRDATLRYSAGDSSDVLNLTTQGFVGLPGDLFFLQRYLRNHPPPQHVVIAAAPDDYAVMTDPRMVHYYMWNTFSTDDEHAFLKTYMPSIDARERFPAAMDLQERIVEHLFALTKRGSARFDQAPPAPAIDAPVEPDTTNQASVDAMERRVKSTNLALAPLYRAAITNICNLSRQYGFSLDVVWAPMPPLVAEQRNNNGQLAALDQQLKEIFATAGCPAGPIFNMNDVQTFADFDGGAFHLRGSGWEQRAAAVLHRYIQDLPEIPPHSVSRVNADGHSASQTFAHTGR